VFRFPYLVAPALLGALVGCSAPAPAETSLSLVSERGLLDADVRIVTPVQRGNNELFVTLRPHAADGTPRLLAVDATMAAHAHTAQAELIDETPQGFHAAQLDLFMTGRWLLTLELSLADEPDSVSLAIDVP
jgi:hypothetical protein